MQEASPEKIRKTGNVVLDKINQEVEQQRLQVFQGDISMTSLLRSDSEGGDRDGNGSGELVDETGTAKQEGVSMQNAKSET